MNALFELVQRKVHNFERWPEHGSSRGDGAFVVLGALCFLAQLALFAAIAGGNQ